MDSSRQPARRRSSPAGFGILALLLSGIGVYGVTALAVSRQTHDIGIRMALGAEPRHIAFGMGRRGIWLVVVGLTLGLVGSVGFGRVATALLYGVTATGSATFAGMSALLAVVSLTRDLCPRPSGDSPRCDCCDQMLIVCV